MYTREKETCPSPSKKFSQLNAKSTSVQNVCCGWLFPRQAATDSIFGTALQSLFLVQNQFHQYPLPDVHFSYLRLFSWGRRNSSVLTCPCHCRSLVSCCSYSNSRHWDCFLWCFLLLIWDRWHRVFLSRPQQCAKPDAWLLFSVVFCVHWSRQAHQSCTYLLGQGYVTPLRIATPFSLLFSERNRQNCSQPLVWNSVSTGCPVVSFRETDGLIPLEIHCRDTTGTWIHRCPEYHPQTNSGRNWRQAVPKNISLNPDSLIFSCWSIHNEIFPSVANAVHLSQAVVTPLSFVQRNYSRSSAALSVCWQIWNTAWNGHDQIERIAWASRTLAEIEHSSHALALNMTRQMCFT